MDDETSEKSNGVNGMALKRRSKRRGLREEAGTAASAGERATVEPTKTPPIDPAIEDVHADTTSANHVPVQVTTSVGPAWFRRIEHPSIKRGDPTKGWVSCSTDLLYSAEANGWQMLEILCVDIRIWPGIGEVLICRSKDHVIVRQNDSELYRVPPGKSFAVLPVGTLMHILTRMESDPDCVVEGRIWPTIERRLEDGRWIIDYELDMRVVEGLDRKAAWRG